MRKRTFLAFFVVALLVRLVVAAKFGVFHWLAHSETEVIALNLVDLGRYDLYEAPTAHAAPLFPLFLAGIFSLLGGGVLGQAVSATLACAVSALRCALVPLFATDAGLDRPVGLVAGALSVLYIGSVDTEVSGKFDGPFVALALMALVWAVMRLWRDGSWQIRTPWWFLVFCGFCGLLNPSLFPVMGGFFLAGAIACPAAIRGRYLRLTGLAILTILIFLTPWAIRNQIALGAPILTRSNFGLEFWVSNGPGRTFDLQSNIGDTFHPSGHADETAKVAEMGEVAYNRAKLADALEWVQTNPGDFLLLVVQRIAGWWFPPHQHLLVVPKFALTLMAFAGLWLMFRHGHRGIAWLILITWLTFPDVHYLVQWIGRYRMPMDWQILLCASVALCALFRIKDLKKAYPPVPSAIQ